MHQALYRKYRPNSFDSVYGQDHITSILRHEALNDSVSHAYLFSGSRGTGKTTCAKILAKSVNCLNLQNGNPCNECANCLAIDEGTTTDVIEMDAATNTGVDYIRDLRENVMFTPAMLKKRVYIIDEAHMLSDSAFNALLKTIEEPPEHVLYIFATTEQHKIPATIISRCQRFEFRRISLSSLVERLLFIAHNEGIKLSDEGAKIIAKTAQGGMRDAISLMELCAGSHKEITPELVNEILGTSSYEKMAKVTIDIANKRYSELFEAVNDIVTSSKDILVFFQDLTSFYRDMMVKKSAPKDDYLELLPNEDKALTDACALFNMATLIYHTTLLDDAYANMIRNPANKRLCAEITLMKMCDPRLNDTNDALLSRIASLEDKITLMSKGAYVEAAQPEVIKETPEKNVEEVQEEITKEENTSFGTSSFVDSWEDIIAKIATNDVSISSILKTCKPAYSSKNNKYYIIANQFNFMILNNDATRKKIFDALVCCEVDITSPLQLEIVTKNIKAEISDLDEF